MLTILNTLVVKKRRRKKYKRNRRIFARASNSCAGTWCTVFYVLWYRSFQSIYLLITHYFPPSRPPTQKKMSFISHCTCTPGKQIYPEQVKQSTQARNQRSIPESKASKVSVIDMNKRECWYLVLKPSFPAAMLPTYICSSFHAANWYMILFSFLKLVAWNINLLFSNQNLTPVTEA